jgi:hypothetical protein
MAASGLRFKDKLDGVSNYSAWKERIILVLIENDIWEFVNSIVAPPADPKDLATHNLKDVKARDNPRWSEGSLDPSFIRKELSQGHVGGFEKLVSKKERESQDGAEIEAQGHKDDKIRYCYDLSHLNPTSSR